MRRGKGRKARLTYLAPGAKAALDAWLALRGTVVGPLFLPLTKSNRAALRTRRPQAVAETLARWASEAAVALALTPGSVSHGDWQSPGCRRGHRDRPPTAAGTPTQSRRRVMIAWGACQAPCRESPACFLHHTHCCRVAPSASDSIDPQQKRRLRQVTFFQTLN